MSSFPSISIPSDPIPIPLFLMPTFGSSSSGGPSLGFSMGGGIHSTSTNPMRNSTSSSVSVPFGWNISSGFGVVPSYNGGSGMLEGFKFPWINTPFPGGTSLGGKFSPWDGFTFVNTFGPGGFFPETNFGNVFPVESTFTPRGTFGFGSSHAHESATIPRGTHSLRATQPSNSTNIVRPLGPSSTTETSPTSQYSFSHTLFPFLAMLEFPNLS
jgi:hypothetical protein